MIGYRMKRKDLRDYLDRKMHDAVRLYHHGLKVPAIAAVIDHSDELTIALLNRAVDYGLLRNQEAP